MASADLPCDADGRCMLCKAEVPGDERVMCHTCDTPWHAPCLSVPIPNLAALLNWKCPDCSPVPDADTSSAPVAAPPRELSSLVASIRAIEADENLTDRQKARRRQALFDGTADEVPSDDEKAEAERKRKGKDSAEGDLLALLGEKFKCSFCMQLPERPVTTPCGHNFCLKCFEKWVGQGKHNCIKCRSSIPSKMASQPRINAALVQAIRMARTSKSTSNATAEVFHYVRNEDRPEKAFTTERAKRNGKANACSGKIFVTIPPDHFGPILAENDPDRNTGVLVGEIYEDRMECRQWGAHFPHVAGIAGQSDYGAQSVALSGGYEDDEDHGEWFLYTGSGGRDLSGNKRTNKEQAFDQKFDKLNEALRVSCKLGYPVRVVRSHKEKRSSYAPEAGVRYDGVYRIEKCWRKVGIQGYKVCRYLFVRCDNAPAPWTSVEYGDRPRPLPDIKELKEATDITERKEIPAWDYTEENGWCWVKNPPVSRKQVRTADPMERKRAREAIKRAKNSSIKKGLLIGFGCLICREVMSSPITTPCGHNFCRKCLLESYADKAFIRERTYEGGRTLRAQKIVKNCPNCGMDISDFLQNPQVNRDLEDMIESLRQKADSEDETSKLEDDNEKAEKLSEEDGSGASDEDESNTDGDPVCHKLDLNKSPIGVGNENTVGLDQAVSSENRCAKIKSEEQAENESNTEIPNVSSPSVAKTSRKRKHTTVAKSSSSREVKDIVQDNNGENHKTSNKEDNECQLQSPPKSPLKPPGGRADKENKNIEYISISMTDNSGQKSSTRGRPSKRAKLSAQFENSGKKSDTCNDGCIPMDVDSNTKVVGSGKESASKSTEGSKNEEDTLPKHGDQHSKRGRKTKL